MSLFDYKCKSCDHKVEDVIEPYSAYSEPIVCPSCGLTTLVRLDVYQTWFSLGGTGWSYGSSNCNNHKV